MAIPTCDQLPLTLENVLGVVDALYTAGRGDISCLFPQVGLAAACPNKKPDSGLQVQRLFFHPIQ